MSNTDELKHIHFSLLGSTAGKNDLYLKNLEPEHEIAPPWKTKAKNYFYKSEIFYRQSMQDP